MEWHGLALGLPQICPMKSEWVQGHSLSCASVVFERLRGTALSCDDMRRTTQLPKHQFNVYPLEAFDSHPGCV